MRFTSLIFLLFFLTVYVAFWGWRRPRLILLYCASILFYAVWSPAFALHFLTILSLSYAFVARLHRGGGRRWLLATLALNFANLILFKYVYALFLFCVDVGLADPAARAGFDQWLGQLGLAGATGVVLPLAISFYTFQICGYALDVGRGQVPQDPGYLRFAVFILFFPQLVAGPIMRHQDFFDQLANIEKLEPRAGQLSGGMALLIQGLAKKLLIADNLAPLTTKFFWEPGLYDWQSNVAACAGFAAQLYCDFSGYTDIARGLGRLLGLELPENFFGPYLSTSFRNFWQAWHRTLTTWLRDYVYIPLGGNRVSPARRAFNTMIVLFLVGVWHGAGYNFAVLGLAAGAYLVLEDAGGRALDAFRARWPRSSEAGPLRRFARLVCKSAFTLSMVCLLMVMMKTPDFARTLDVYRQIFGGASGVRYASVDILWGGLAAALCFNALQKWRDRLFNWPARNPRLAFAGLWTLGFAFLILLGRLTPRAAEFIYFEF